VNIFRFEKTLYAIDEFTKQVLGERFATPIVPNMHRVFQDTDYKTPLIFILSPGADPLMNILKFSKEMNIAQEAFTMISLGQGQGVVAEKAIQDNIKTGGWVLL
jgi:dynein heavy chain, axonemal